jgi:hypothetical protein
MRGVDRERHPQEARESRLEVERIPSLPGYVSTADLMASKLLDLAASLDLLKTSLDDVDRPPLLAWLDII